MDMAPGIKGKIKADYQLQLEKMREIRNEYPGALLPFFAADPNNPRMMELFNLVFEQEQEGGRHTGLPRPPRRNPVHRRPQDGQHDQPNQKSQSCISAAPTMTGDQIKEKSWNNSHTDRKTTTDYSSGSAKFFPKPHSRYIAR